MLNLQEAAIISTTVQAILYGFALFMFCMTIWILLKNRHKRRVTYGMLIAGCALILLATIEIIVNIVRICEGFLSVGPSLPDGPESYFANVSELTFVLKSCLYNAQTLILDGVVIYRAYVVWQNIYVVIIPMIGWCGLLASSVGTNFALATAAQHSGDVFAVETGRWITATYSATLVTNLISTSLLAFRIWQISRQTASMRAHNILTPVLRAVIESGAIYSAIITAGLISFVVKSNGVYVVLDLISPIISIVFNMIVITVRLSVDPTRDMSTIQNLPTIPTIGGSRRMSNVPLARLPKSYELQSIAIEVKQYQETDAESTIAGGSGSGSV